MKNLIILFALIVELCASTTGKSTFTGTWEYRGGVFNGQVDGAPTAYALKRVYNNNHYKAILIEKGSPNVIYEKGVYSLKADTCFETQTYSLQPSKVTNKTIKYTFAIRKDTLKLFTVLPNGSRVVDDWLKVK